MTSMPLIKRLLCLHCLTLYKVVIYLVRYQSLFHTVDPDHTLHIMHISRPGQQGIPVLMIHGMVEDGRIFYHRSGKGLGSYLAQQGFDVYVADLRGIGQSTPRIGKRSEHGQTETIRDDLPSLIRFVLSHSDQQRLHLVAHSWGGVFLNAALLRTPGLIPSVISSVYFGSKRSVRAHTLDRYLRIELVWNRLSLLASRRNGYLPAVRYKLGSDNETRKTHRQCVEWVKSDDWIDSDDGFDYGEAANYTTLPATVYYAALRDTSLGHRFDVRNFIAESGPHENEYRLLSQNTGHTLDYDHINMLTAPECIDDHFPEVVRWLQRHQHQPSSFY